MFIKKSRSKLLKLFLTVKFTCNFCKWMNTDTQKWLSRRVIGTGRNIQINLFWRATTSQRQIDPSDYFKFWNITVSFVHKLQSKIWYLWFSYHLIPFKTLTNYFLKDISQHVHKCLMCDDEENAYHNPNDV